MALHRKIGRGSMARLSLEDSLQFYRDVSQGYRTVDRRVQLNCHRGVEGGSETLAEVAWDAGGTENRLLFRNNRLLLYARRGGDPVGSSSSVSPLASQ